jgi:activating signal cointegrator 1
MKALSMTQPWASLVVLGAKKFETRSWRTPYRGPLVIHAAKFMPRWAIELCRYEPYYSALQRVYPLPRGAIIGVVSLDLCFPTESIADTISPDERAFGDWAKGRWAWQFSHPVQLEKPVTWKGSLGLWDADYKDLP